MDHSKELVLRTDSFLLSSDNVQISYSPIGFGLGDSAFFHGIASGEGFLALTRPGGIVSIVLRSGEECIVDPENIIAWDASMHVESAKMDAVPETTQVVWKNLEWMTQKGIPFRFAAESVLFYFTRYYRKLVQLFRYWILGQRGASRFQGPGEIFICTLKRNQY